MELIFEFIYEIFLEGTIALIRNKNLPRPLRIMFLTLLLAPFFALFYYIYHEPAITGVANFISGLGMAAMILGWLCGVIWILRK